MLNQDRLKFVHVRLNQPEMGNKIWLIQERGIYLLEDGPGMLAGISCTFAGSCTFVLYDGVCDDSGNFPTPPKTPTTNPTMDYAGRPIWRSHPLYMGMNQLNGGFVHGLTAIVQGSVDPTVTITWASVKKRTSEPLPTKKPESGTLAGSRVVKTPAAPQSLMRSYVVDTPGIWELSRRDCELYALNSIKSGMGVRVDIYNGKQRKLFSLPAGSQPSFCSDSFPIGGGAEGGLIVQATGPEHALLFGVTWRERDRLMV